MRYSLAFPAIAIIGGAIVLGGCSLFPAQKVPLAPTPSPMETSAFPNVDDLDDEGFNATPSSVPVATTSATTKGGLVRGATTQKTTVTKRQSPSTTLFDTNFDSWYIINYPGQHYEKELILSNKSDLPMMYSVRAADRFSDTNPVSVNGTFEATGNMLPLSQEIVKLKALSSDQTPGFTTTVTVNFINQSNQILATKNVKITAYTAVGDRIHVDTDTPTDKASNQTVDVTYKSLAAYPIRLINRNQRDLKFEAKIVSPDAAKVMSFSAKSGSIRSGAWWDTDIHFLTKDVKVNEATIEFTFFAEGDDTYRASKTLTLKIK